jgi:polyisoprenyl-teichoic acid--peptidoglycan teichoic acid transferase
MRLLKGDLLSGKQRIAPPPTVAGKTPAAFFYSPAIFLIVFAISFAFGRVSLTEGATAAFETLERVPIIGSGMQHLMRSPDRKLDGEAGDQINVLLMGMGGEGHDGPNLTDTIILARVRPSDNKVALLSIPRDLLVPVEGFGWKKINAVNAFGETAARGRGGELARETVENLLGIDVPYYVRIDFAGFKQIVDSVGGIDVYVERAFTDHQYPTANYLTKTVSFDVGWQHMDGATALVYSRSRHGNNGEGNDFARAKRQQNVIDVLKDKLLSARTYRNPAVIADTLSALQSNVTTNLSVGEILRFARMAQKLEDVTILRKVIVAGPGEPLAETFLNGAYVLVPRNDDWTLLRDAAASVFDDAEVSAAVEAPPKPTDSAAVSANVEIRNGSGRSGIAREVATQLKTAGLEVLKIGNADSFDYETTTIYDLTSGELSASLASLRRALPEAIVAKRIPAELASSASPDVDFVLIVGKDE